MLYHLMTTQEGWRPLPPLKRALSVVFPNPQAGVTLRSTWLLIVPNQVQYTDVKLGESKRCP